ncbi:MAG: hypothetical protein WBG57_01250 [Ornithinimicrobium sp.]
MKHPRMAAIAALSSLVLVTACSNSEEEPAADSATSSEASAGDDSQATTDVEQETAEPGDDAEETTEAEGVGVIGIEQAEEIATDLLTSAAEVNNGSGEKIEAPAAAAYRGNTEVAALAADELEEVTGKPKKRDLDADPIEPNVLAISRDDGESPLLMLVQTVPDSGTPELYVMASPGAPERFRIVWSAPMLPGTDIGTFDRRSLGSPILREGKGDLPQSPVDLLEALGDYLDYPARDVLDVKTNGYAPQVRKAADSQAEAVSTQAEFTESNSVPERTYTFFREDGSAVTFAVLKRQSDFTVREGMELTPPEEYLVFDDEEAINTRARLYTNVFVAMTLPMASERPEMIAAREQLVDSEGF